MLAVTNLKRLLTDVPPRVDGSVILSWHFNDDRLTFVRW